jgi:glycosidase
MKTWIDSAVIYQINPRSLAAREPRNAFEAAGWREPSESALAYVTRGLARLKRLGVNTIYLMPPYPMGNVGRKGIGSPYSIRDFQAVDPEYGTIEDLTALIAQAHRRKLRLILDITPNHTSRDHVWTQQHPDFHVRNGDGTLFHDFDWSDTAKLDYRRPELRRAMIEVYEFWLTRGVDGFRLDMAHIVNDPTFWNEATAELRARYPDRELLFLAESYGARNNRDLFSRGINAAYDDDFYKVCVYGYAVDPDGRSMIRLAPEAWHNGDFAELLAAFREGGIAGAFERALGVYEESLPAGAGPWLARYTDNHDEGRGVYRFGRGATRAAMTLAFLSPHAIPFLLTGQEFGALNRPPIHVRAGVCDKGRRVVAGGGEHTEPGIEFEGNVFARSGVEREEWYGFYRNLIRLRSRNAALRGGAFRLLDAGERCERAARTVVAFERGGRGVNMRCAVNMGPDTRVLERAELFEGTRLWGGLEHGALAGFEAVVVKNA